MALKVRHIDGERHLLRIEQGKGAKDRQVILSDGLLQPLRAYWQRYHPTDWLFPGREPDQPLDVSSPQRVFTVAKCRAGIDKVGGIHSLRHAYATHQLEAGLPVHQLQQLLGHRGIRTTLHYVHWIPRYREGQGGTDLIAVLAVKRSGGTQKKGSRCLNIDVHRRHDARLITQTPTFSTPLHPGSLRQAGVWRIQSPLYKESGTPYAA